MDRQNIAVRIDERAGADALRAEVARGWVAFRDGDVKVHSRGQDRVNQSEMSVQSVTPSPSQGTARMDVFSWPIEVVLPCQVSRPSRHLKIALCTPILSMDHCGA